MYWMDVAAFTVSILALAWFIITCLYVMAKRTRPEPPRLGSLRESIELFAQLTDEDQEAELAILRERVKAKKAGRL